MRLRNLRVRNFRPFPADREISFDLDHSAVLVYGGNGTGKSSLFDAIEMGLTGAVKNLEGYGEQSRFLINARHPREIATVALEVSGSAEPNRTRIEIRPETERIIAPTILRGYDLDLFYHTTYLLQSNLHRLVSADSETLGEIITRLVVDESIANLSGGLAEANISRADGAYQRAKFGIEELERELAQVTDEINDRDMAIASIQASRVSLNDLATRITTIGKTLELNIPNSRLSSLQTIQSLAKELDEVLRKRIDAASVDQTFAQRSLNVSSSLSSEESRLQTNLPRINQLRASLQRTKKQLANTRRKIKEVAAELKGHVSQSTSRDQLSAIIHLLTDAAAIAEPQVCPVCDRHYPNLLQHIRQKLARLEKQQTADQKTANQIQMRLTNLRVSEETLRQSVETQEQDLAAFASELESVQKTASAFLSTYSPKLGRATTLSEIENYEKMRLQELSKTYDQLVELVESVSEIQTTILTASRGISRQKETVDTLASRRLSLEQTLKQKRAAFDRLSSFIDATQDTRRRLSELIENLLEEFVQGRARTAFEDLFRRIARHPYFQVTIPSSQVKYHKPEVSWVASLGGNFYPGGAVFSQGQLNACGLAFFLALATTQSNHLGLLLLDDPVQSMDEVHIEEFATVLKSIKDVLGWQLIIGVHEQSLFNYLKRVLYPTGPKQSLIAYTLGTNRDGPTITGEETIAFDARAFSLRPANSAA